MMFGEGYQDKKATKLILELVSSKSCYEGERWVDATQVGRLRRQRGMQLCGCCSAAKLCPTLGNPMDCSTPGSSDFHCLPEFAQIHVHWVGDATEFRDPLKQEY